MILRYRKTLCVLWVLLAGLPFVTKGQSISVGTPIAEEYLRRQQLLGVYDSSITFSQRPLFFEAEDSLQVQIGAAMTVYENEAWKARVSVLSPHTHVEWNSHHPQYSNNGAITPAKGFQSLTSLGGIHVKWFILSVQVKPEILLSENKAYDGFPDTLSTRLWDKRYVKWNRTDLPEQFGHGPKNNVFLGQSHAMLTYAGIGAGISTENLWWGPGKRNSLMMSNNARAFRHLTFKTMKPLWTPVGYFEWQILSGRLEQSGYNPPVRDPDSPTRRLGRKNPDNRYLSALHVSYSPRWIRGLTFGMSRAVQQYMEDAKENKDYFPVFINIFRKNDDPTRNEAFVDQLISIYGRWLWRKENAEIYFEFGKNDAALNMRDFLLGPEHARAYIFGVSKLFELGKKGTYLEFNYEHTEMAQPVSYLVRNAFSWYFHSGVRQGYTQHGETLGAAIGPGSNLDYFSAAYINGMNRYGLRFERMAQDNDFYYLAFDNQNDWRRFWVDYSFGAEATHKIKWVPLVVEGSFLFTRSLNYQWELYNNPPGQRYFTAGNDVSNFQLTFKALYLF